MSQYGSGPYGLDLFGVTLPPAPTPVAHTRATNSVLNLGKHPAKAAERWDQAATA
jgi:hypothetical protein